MLFSGNKKRMYARAKSAFTKQITAFSAWFTHLDCQAAHSVKFSSQVANYFSGLGE